MTQQADVIAVIGSEARVAERVDRESAKTDALSDSSAKEVEQVEAVLKRLDAKKREWAALPLREKLQLLQEVRVRFLRNMEPWARAGANVRGFSDQTSVAFEMVLNFTLPGAYLNRVHDSLTALERTGKPTPVAGTRQLPNGQLAVEVFPLKRSDKFSINGAAKAELFLQPGAALEQEAEDYREPKTNEGGLCAILGAGNYGCLGLRDVFVTMFEHNEVAVLKHHPMWAEWASFCDDVLQPLTSRGYCATMLCGNQATAHLMRHPLVTHAHITGGTATHDILAWGTTPEEQARRKAANDPLIKVPFTSELGCVSPVIITPGTWTDKQLDAYAAHIAELVFANASCNCNSGKVLVLPEGWAQGEELLRRIKQVMAKYPLKPAFYPGICQRYDVFKQRYPQSEEVVPTVPPSTPSRPMPGPRDHLPWLFNDMGTLPADPQQEHAFQVEPFAPVVSIVRVPAPSVPEFLRVAVALANDGLWGSLSGSILVHPDVEAQHKEAVEAAIQELRYGCVGVNTWAATCFGLGTPTWGAFPGNPLSDIESGSGPYGNPLFVKHVQKSVLRVPFAHGSLVKPLHMMPLPLVLAKAVVGASANGVAGVARALLSK